MKFKIGFILFAAFIISLSLGSCFKRTGEKMMNQLEALEAEAEELASDVGESLEGEESGMQFGLSDECDEVRKGAHLVLSYDAEKNLFRGTVENTTEEILENVRVEVHLSNGIELGPTEPVDLPAGETVVFDLEGSEEEFETWSAHAEVGSGEHLHEGEGEHGESHEEGEHEHDEEGEHEHN